jgi:hypothetical protein
MALTPAEKQKAYRDRLKGKRKAEPELTAAFLSGRFSDFLNNDRAAEQDISFIDETLDSVGLDYKVPLTDDCDPDWREDWGTPNRGSLGRAERMVDALIDSAKALSEIINRYKAQEIDAALKKVGASKHPNWAARKKALVDFSRLSSIRTRLNKEVRHAFLVSTVKGE